MDHLVLNITKAAIPLPGMVSARGLEAGQNGREIWAEHIGEIAAFLNEAPEAA